MFEFTLEKNHEGKPIKIRTVFSGQSEGTEFDYEEKVGQLFRNDKRIWDWVLFVFPEYISEELKKYFSVDGKPYQEIMNRKDESTHVLLCVFDEYGGLKHLSTIGSAPASVDYKKLSEEVVTKGLMSLALKRKDSVILKAPPGTVFRKPSEKRFEEFIMASELGVHYSDNQFIAFSLLSKRPVGHISDIYIDTANIAKYVEPLIYYLKRFSSESEPYFRYFSFGSYGGKAQIRPSAPEGVWVIISASVSNDLAGTLSKDWGVSPDQLTTILSYTSLKSNGRILVNISDLSDASAQNSHMSSLLDVQIMGENFSAEIGEPRSVIIKKRHGTGTNIEESIEPFKASGLFSCNKFIPEKSLLCSISINESNFCEEELSDWVSSVVTWEAAIATAQVLYDHHSVLALLMANQAKEKLQELGGKCVSLLPLSEIKKIDLNSPIVIMSGIARTGRTLLQINRDLRSLKHSSYRLFLVPYAVFSSLHEMKTMRASLIHAGKGKRYRLSVLHEIFIGHNETKSSWELELSLIGTFKDDFWKKRKKHLETQGDGLQGRIGVCPKDKDGRLDFTDGMVFWSKYDAKMVDPEAVYITIASILQKLREQPHNVAAVDSLQSHTYQHAVLSPENFDRFNDGLIQSCLWRAAYSTELDYRNSDSVSRTFKDVLAHLCERYSKGEKTGAVDLLVGIAVGKIKLNKDSLTGLVKLARQYLKHDSAALELISSIDTSLAKPEFSQLESKS